MNMNGIIAGLIAALKVPKMAWNVLKHGDDGADKRTDQDVQDFIDNVYELKQDLEKMCKSNPSYPLCKQYFSGYYDRLIGDNKPTLDKTMVGKTIPKKDLEKNTVKLNWKKIS